MADVIGMSRLADERSAACFSPDGRKFVTLIRRGNLEKNTNEYVLLLWKTADVFSSPRPGVVLTLSTSSNRAAIGQLMWLRDNRTLAFLGEHPGELQQLYLFDTETHGLRRITDERTNVLGYDIAPNGRLVYTVEKPEPLFDDRSRRDGLVVTTSLTRLFTGQEASSDWRSGAVRLMVGSYKRAERRPPAVVSRIRSLDRPFVSPNGRYVVVRAIVPSLPASWREYGDSELERQIGWLARFVLVDTRTHQTRPLVDAPIKSLSSLVAWAPDSRSVALAGVYLPLAGRQAVGRLPHPMHTFLIDVDIRDSHITPIADEDSLLGTGKRYYGSALHWNPTLDVLSYETATLDMASEMVAEMRFKRLNGQWTRLSGSARQSRPTIVSEEDLNAPPRIYAVGPTTEQRALLLDLNPRFRGLRFGHVQEIRWQQPDGGTTAGGLYYPPDYVPGKRYPLVIQTHGWTAKRFWPDGPYTTAFAAQPMAGHELMVLQLDEVAADLPTPDEMRKEVAIYESAVDFLDKEGLIDRRRVGLIGFSRTSLSVKYALTHSRYAFAAASVTDGLDGGYMQLLERFNAGRYFIDFSEALNGGLPYGEGIKSWLTESPGFNLDKVKTPLRIVALHPSSAIGEWEWFAGLSLLGKPVDMVVVEDGTHVLQRPRDRMISQQGTVDWFSFWLTGEQDPDPAKADQYARWRALRTLQP